MTIWILVMDKFNYVSLYELSGLNFSLNMKGWIFEKIKCFWEKAVSDTRSYQATIYAKFPNKSH